MARGNRAFTLAEAMFSFMIIFMVLGGLSTTLRQAADVKKNTKNMDRAIEEFHALLTIKNDILAALSIASPLPGETTASVSLERVNPRLSIGDRMSTLGDPLDPFESTERTAIEYNVDAGILKRNVTPADLAVTTAERLMKVETFQAELSTANPPLLTVTITTKGTRVTKTRAIKVALKR